MSTHLSPDPFQMFMRHHPFWLAIACLMTEGKNWSNVKAKFWSLRAGAQNDPFFFALDCPPALHQFVVAWLQSEPKTTEDLSLMPGVTQYLMDSWSIFVELRLDVEPKDKELRSYTNEISTHKRWVSSGLHD